MKQIIPLGKGKFIHLDSYGESNETRRSDIMVAVLAIIITTVTVGAALGIDITSPNSTLPANPHRAYR